MAAVTLGVDANGVWAAWAGRARAWASRHAVLVRRVRLLWTLWAWVSLASFVLGLVVVPSARPGVQPWLWAYYGVVQLFLVARTKTLSWRFLAVVFSVGCLAGPLIGLADVAVSGLIGADINSADGAVYVAGPVEETLKLAPLLALLVFARRRVKGFAVVDFPLVGYAAGFAFQAVEDAIRQIVNEHQAAASGGVGGGGLGGLIDLTLDMGGGSRGEAQYGWGWLQGSAKLDLTSAVPTSEVAYFGGHAVPAALVAVAIGLAFRLRWRLGLLVWLLPVAMFGMVVVDHAMYNEVANRPIIDLPEINYPDPESLPEGFDLPPDPSAHEAEVPGGVQEAWRTWGRGRFERPLLTVLLVGGMMLDVRRLRRARTTVPPLPDIPSARRLRDVAESVGTSLRLAAARSSSLVRVLVGLLAEGLRWLIHTVADIVHELVLAFLGAGRDPPPPARSPYLPASPGPGFGAASPYSPSAAGAQWSPPSAGQGPASASPGPGPGPAGSSAGEAQSARARMVGTLFYLRTRRQLAHLAEVEADRRRPRTGLRGIWRDLAAAGLVVVLALGLAGLVTAAAATADGDVTTATAVPAAASLASTADSSSAVGAGDAVFLANLFQELGEWWDSLSFAEQTILILGAAFLLSWGFGWAFLPTLGYVGMGSTVAEHGQGTADFIRDPREATRRFFRELTPTDVLWYLGTEAVGRVIPAGSSAIRNRLRRNVDGVVEAADSAVPHSRPDAPDAPDTPDAPRPRGDEPDVDAPSAHPPTGPSRQPSRDGRWITPGQEPGVGPRNFNDVFNQDYEEWVRREAGGPPGQEFRYNDVDFDGIDTRIVDGQEVDVLLDAKGHYEQFIDPATGGWKHWWRGADELMARADRQVRAAAGNPVEWPCAEQGVADALNRAFLRDPDLRGKIRAVFRPMEG